MGQQETAVAGSSALRRTILALLVAALMAATMAASALPAMADSTKNGVHGPPSQTGDLDGQGKGSGGSKEGLPAAVARRPNLRGRRR